MLTKSFVQQVDLKRLSQSETDKEVECVEVLVLEEETNIFSCLHKSPLNIHCQLRVRTTVKMSDKRERESDGQGRTRKRTSRQNETTKKQHQQQPLKYPK
jgi:hypothetical protein